MLNLRKESKLLKAPFFHFNSNGLQDYMLPPDRMNCLVSNQENLGRMSTGQAFDGSYFDATAMAIR